MEIMDAFPDHVSQIAGIENECFSQPWPEEIILRNLTDDSHIMLAAMSGGEVAGYIGLMHILDEGYISNVAVSGARRRLGVADQLLNAMKSRAEQLGLSFLTLEVRASNEPAISLYKKHGFAEVGRRRGYYEEPAEDAILMTLFL